VREGCGRILAANYAADETGQKPKVAQADSLYPAGWREACGPV